jgi:hypothetical protein
MNFLGKLWRGLYPLPGAFWGFYVGGFFASALAGGIILIVIGRVGSRPIGLALGAVVYLGYMLIATIGVWRSAGVRLKSPIWMERIWAWVARTVVAIYAAIFVWRLIDGGATAFLARLTGSMDF